MFQVVEMDLCLGIENKIIKTRRFFYKGKKSLLKMNF